MPEKTTQEVYRERACKSADLAAILYDADSDERLFKIPDLTSIQVEQLEAFWVKPASDGYVISKQVRGELVEMGLVERWNGWNFITKAGVAVLDTLKGFSNMEFRLKVTK